ncbi:MAG: imidazole glycerol phosphate synthase subunit HisH [Candidatus Magasanikbacteria bacterium]
MITIIDYNASNIGSLKNAIGHLGFECSVTSDPNKIKNAKKIIFPGQGRAGSAMRELKRRSINTIIKNINVPFLGICLGMQLLADYSEEDETECLSIIPGKVNKFAGRLKVPHIGWNSVQIKTKSPLLNDLKNNEYFYFVHSYYFQSPEQDILGLTDYGIRFPSIIQKNNFYAVQFHPEKSGKAGLRLLHNFCVL